MGMAEQPSATFFPRSYSVHIDHPQCAQHLISVVLKGPQYHVPSVSRQGSGASAVAFTVAFQKGQVQAGQESPVMGIPIPGGRGVFIAWPQWGSGGGVPVHPRDGVNRIFDRA